MNVPQPKVPDSLDEKKVEIPECFMCGDTTNNVRFCSMCRHYFCDDCRVKYGDRLVAAAEEKMNLVKDKLSKLNPFR